MTVPGVLWRIVHHHRTAVRQHFKDKRNGISHPLALSFLSFPGSDICLTAMIDGLLRVNFHEQ